MLPAVVVLSLIASAPTAGTDAACDVGGSGHAVRAFADALPAMAHNRFVKIFHGLRAVDPETTLDVDERHVRFTLVGGLVTSGLTGMRLPLALPAPWSGTVELVPSPPDAKLCARAHAVLFDKELREVGFEHLPLDVTVTFGKKGQPSRTIAVKQDGLVFGGDTVTAKVGDVDELRLYVGDAPPADELLEQDGADVYMKSLAALDVAIVDDMRAHPSPQAQRVLFAELAAALRTGLRTWTPERRLSEIARFDEKAMPAEMRPLLHFWRSELGRSAARADQSVHLIIDDAVQGLWIDGAEVFNRKRGMPTGFDLKVPKDAVRAWIITHESGARVETPVVHDTRAVLKDGEIYSVTSTFVQHVRGGGRRECVRVVGKLPDNKDIRWREISGAHTPFLGDDETYRPSGASAERALSVVPGGDARPFPPMPLVYSYTHPGLYKWTLSADGGVKLELVDDESVCLPQH